MPLHVRETRPGTAATVPSRRSYSTRLHLLALALSLLLPVLGVAGYVGWRFAESERARLDQQAEDLARNTTIAIDRELRSIITALQVLGLAESLQSWDLPSFHHRATQVAQLQGTTIALRDLNSGVLLSSNVPWGAPLPARSSFVDADRNALDTGSPAVSNFFVGVINQLPSIGVVLPVVRNGQTSALLSASFDVQRLRSAMAEELPPGWNAALVDSKGIVITRLRDPDISGQPAFSSLLAQARQASSGIWRGENLTGTPAFAAFKTTQHGWIVTVGTTSLNWRAGMTEATTTLVAGSLVLVALAVAMALVFARGITLPFKALGGMAVALGRGEIVSALEFSNKEANLLAASLERASTELHERDRELRGSIQRYRNLFNSIDQGFCVLEMIFDEDGNTIDYRILEANPAFERHTGLVGAQGRTVLEIVPDLEPHWFERYGKVARTGESVRFEDNSPALGRWFDVYAFRLEGTADNQVAVLFQDISAKREMETKLRENELRYKSALRVGRIGSWETNFVTGIRTWSEEGMRLFRISLPDGKGRVGGEGDEWRKALHPDDADVPDRIYQMFKTDDRIQVEYRVLRPDGDVLHLFGHGEVAERDAQGRVVRLVSVVADVTALKRTEAALRASEARFRAVQETSIDGFMVLDSIRDEHGRIIDFRWQYANVAAERIVGRPRDWFIGRRLLQEMPGNLQSGLFDAYVRVVETGEPWTNEFVYTYEGLDIYIRALCAKVNDGFAVSFADLSERRRAEARVRESEARLTSALAAGQLGVHDYDPRTGSVKWDKTVRDFWGLDADEPVTFEVFAAGVHPEDLSGVQKALDAALDPAGSRHYRHEYRVINKRDGSIRWVVADGDVSFEGDTPVRLVGTARDITELKAAEAHRRLLLEELNHRVKNSLATVKAIASQTLRGTPTPAAVAAFEARLFALARAHDTLIREEWTSARLRDVVDQALAPHVDQRDQRISMDGPDAMLDPRTALALTMCLHELATNALKYGALSGDSGQVSVTWTIEQRILTLRWRESGGPAVTPPRQRGFGSRLIDRVLSADPNGKAELSFDERGVICTVTASVHVSET